ncbi:MULTISPECIES: DUF4350 domain-containing protein [unclassified Beijerinckia]|uniref:DUF4350 domain-containing protein n=1 Tax=unclassified Beijerinckia TaxID=2638183 RepID=UPI0008980F35|nr:MULTISPECIES: DUF4350 domain-containing protein [unclassified Beijerinckia]MDH7794586.1 hypothetical protein [Beijerinckia sp. GAS462]SEB67575.1 hypothetical protein SAMN05443249_0857 [Beijerinckia sp. 28-YEA-48]
MKPALYPSFGHPEGSGAALAQKAEALGAVVSRDIYDLDRLDLNDYGALLISMHSDQRFLASQASSIAAFLAQGGTVVANGHIAYPFLPGIGQARILAQQGLEDLRILRLADHPIWAGVSCEDLTFRRGVAGFYGRAWHDPPSDALVINAVGAPQRALDIIYPVGRGRVLLHGGNDLWQFGGGDSTARLLPQFFHWLFAPEVSP